ncbi:MAG: phosphate ABC transporter ATP-binding protein [Oligoflexales bacterium]
MEPLLTVSDLTIKNQNSVILKDAEFSIYKNSITSVVGPSGAGKTTLLRSINRLLDECDGYDIKGNIFLENESLYSPNSNKYEIRRRIGLVFQKPTIFPTSIFKNVIFGIRHVEPRKSKDYYPLVEQCLKDAFLWEEVKNRLHEHALHLSIGQQQRLAISRSLAVGPKILMMDEPTSSLDPGATKEIESLIKRLAEEKAILIVTHDIDQAIKISDQIIALTPNHDGAKTVVFSETKDFQQVSQVFC